MPRRCGFSCLGQVGWLSHTGSRHIHQALDKTGVTLGSHQLRILPSKTAIVPVKRELMPTSPDDIERCGRTVYVTNVDKRVDRVEVRSFFEQFCGKVCKLRVLGDSAHPTRIAFVEFALSEGAQAALQCSGAVIGESACFFRCDLP